MSGPVDSIREKIRERLEEIEAQLGELAAERERLEQALAALNPSNAPATPRRSPGRGSRRRGPSRRAKPTGGGTRSRPGANRERIVAHLRESGPARASAIAMATGINRAVVYTNLTQLTEAGEVRQRDDSGTTQFALAG